MTDPTSEDTPHRPSYGQRRRDRIDALATAFREKDYPVLQVLIMAAAVIYVVVNLLVDIAYAVIDPRIRTR